MQLGKPVTYRDYTNETALEYSGYNKRGEPPANLMDYGGAYDPAAGFVYKDEPSNDKDKDPVFLGPRPVDSPKAILAVIEQLQNAPGMQVCATKPGARECKTARDQLEEKLMAALQTMDYSTPASFTDVIEMFRRLRLAEMQLSALKATVLGDKANPGLKEQMNLIHRAKSQFEQKIDGAYENIQNVVAQRRELMNSESRRLTDLDRNAKITLERVSKKMIATNGRKAGVVLAKSRVAMGHTLNDISTQAYTVGTSWTDGLNELERRYDEWHNDTSSVMETAEKSSRTAKDDGKLLARLMSTALRVVSQQAKLIAESKQRDWLGTAGRSVEESAEKLSREFREKNLKQIMNQVGLTTQDLQQAIATADFNRYPKMRTLQTQASTLSRLVSSQLKSAAGEVMDTAGDLFKNVDAKARYLERLTSDIAKLVADEAGKVQSVRGFGLDSLAMIGSDFDSKIGEIKNFSSRAVDGIASDVTKSIETYGSELNKISADADNKGNDIIDSAKSRAAALIHEAVSSGLIGVDSLGTSARAAQTGAELSAAELKSVTDTARSIVKTDADTMTAGLVEGRDTVNQISSSVAGLLRMAESNLMGTVENFQSTISEKIGNIQINFDEFFKSITGDTNARSREFVMAVEDGRQAVAAVGELENTVEVKISEIKQNLENSKVKLQDFAVAANKMSDIVHAASNTASSAFSQRTVESLAGPAGVIATEAEKKSNAVASSVARGIRFARRRIKLRDAQDHMLGSKDSLRHIAAVLGELGSLPAVGTEESARQVMDAKKKFVFSQLVRELLAMRNEFLNSSATLDEESRHAVAEAIDRSAKIVTIQAGKFSEDLEQKKAVVTTLGNKTQELLKSISLHTGKARQDFEKFNRRVNTSEWRLDSLGINAADLLLGTQKKISDTTEGLIKLLTARTRQTVAESSNMTAESRQRINEAIDSVEQGPKKVEFITGNGTERFDEVRKIVELQAKEFHSRMMKALKAMSITVGDVRQAVEKNILRESLNLTDSEWRVFNVLVGVSDTLDSEEGKSDNMWSNARGEIEKHRNKVTEELIKLSQKMHANYAKLQLVATKQFLGIDKNLSKYLASLGGDLKAADANLTAANEFLKNALGGGARTSDGSEKQAYSISGILRNLSLRNQGRLQGLLEKVISGDITFEEAFAEARKIDLNGIQSTNRAVSLLMGSMIDFQQALYRAFGGSRERLDNSTAAIDEILNARGPEILVKAANVDGFNTNVSEQITKFGNDSDATLAIDTAKVAYLQNAIEENRTAVNMMMGNLANEIDLLEGQMKANQLDFETWIEGTISDEIAKARTKEETLKQKLGLKTPSSFVQGPAEDPVLRFELAEMKKRFRMRNA